MIKATTYALIFAIAPCSAMAAITFDFPGNATSTLTETSDFGSYNLPVGPSAGAPIPTIVAEGPITRTAWRIETAGVSTLSVMDNLRQQVERRGFELLYECATRDCGGFDFRFDTFVLPEPAMHVDLGDFRFLSGQRLGQAAPEYISILVSQSAEFSYVQVIHVGGAENASSEQTPVAAPAPEPAQPVTLPTTGNTPQWLANALESYGHAALDDLVFATGSSALGDGPFASLVELAAILTSSPSVRISLVGHTDNKGSLQGNIALSRQRAASVATRLIETHNAPADRISADGVGFLAPRASNQTEEGRNRNRRVEVVITATD